MVGHRFCLSLFFLLGLAVTAFSTLEFSRDDFPPEFIFGSGTSAYQVEGAAFQDGRTPSIWDTFTHAGSAHGATGDIACDEYHKYEEDVRLMVETGLDAYRFSISWSRLIPYGRGPVNPKGLSYYNNLINELISHGIQPHVTLCHSDLPQALEDEYGGWLSRKILKDFTVYADVCFREFGDRVLYWTTVNEGNTFVSGGYDVGITPLNDALPHLETVLKNKQHGFIGINVFAMWFVPLTNTTEDIIATQRAQDFYLGWIVGALVFGDYPEIVKKRAGTRIPAFTIQESKQVKGSFDFIGINHYFTTYIKNNREMLKMDQRDFSADVAADMIPIQDDSPPDQFSVLPWGLQQLLEYFKQVYGNPPIYIHENGQRTQRNSTLNDTGRVKYLQGYIGGLLAAVRNGSNVKGYFIWSFLDVLELLDGYESSYGLYYVDLDDPDLKRYPKLSAHWYAGFLKGRNITPDGPIEIQMNKTPLSDA